MFIKKINSILVSAVLCFVMTCDSTDAREVDQKIHRITDLIVEGMTLEEKVGQLIHVGVPGKSMSASIEREFEQFKPGGVILFAINMGPDLQLRSFNKALNDKSIEVSGIPLLISVDQEGGRVVRVTESTLQFPGAMATGQTDNAQLAYESAIVTGNELKAIGFNTIFAPTLDINNNPANPVINTRSFGSTKNRVTEMGLAYAKGLSDSNTLGTIKHFPGHGDTNVDSHHDLPVIKKSISQLKEFELVPFEKAIRAGAEGVMTTHILFPEIDSRHPATLSEKIINDLLRNDYGFDGLVFTDAMEMKAIADRYPQGRAAVLAIKAGVDVILLTAQTDNTRKSYFAILKAVQSGEITEQRIELSVKRQILSKLKTGAFSTAELKKFIKDNDLLLHYSAWSHLREKIADTKYRKINSKYSEYDDGLNTFLSRQSIVSARKPFEGLDKKKPVYVFYKTNASRKQAMELNIPEKQVIFTPALAILHSRLASGQYNGHWLIEFDHREISQWNSLAKQWNRDDHLVGLYHSNPFFSLNVPEKGALLFSFSPTVESRKALVYRAINGPVKKADLILKSN